MIPAGAVEIMKIPEHERLARPSFPSGMTVSSDIKSPEHFFASRSQAPTGYHDERWTAIEEGKGHWKMFAYWKAEGPGAVPGGLKMLTQFGSLFNNLFNMLVDEDDLAQEIHSSSRKTANLGQLFDGLLGF